MALKVTVTIAGHDPQDVEVLNPDRIRWDRTRHKHKWPSFQDAPFLGVSFLAWSAMRRTGLYVGTWEDFEEDCLNIDYDDDDDTLEVEGLGNLT